MAALIGRHGELGDLRQALGRARGGRPGWVQVVGEPGIGKTRLLSEVTGWAEAEGWLVLVGGAADLERDIPFAVMVDALDDYLGSLGGGALAALCGHHGSQLAEVFPALAPSDPSSGVSGDRRYGIFRAVRHLLERLALSKPTLLVLDDLQWADPATVQLLSFLRRRPSKGQILTVTAWRSGQAPALERELIGTSGNLRLELEPLEEADGLALLQGISDERMRRALYRESGGNPFYLTELQRVSTRAAGPNPAHGAAAETVRELPPAVAAAVSSEIGSLSPIGHRLAEGAAVAGGSFDPDLAAACAGLAEVDTYHALDELVAAGVVRSDGSPRQFRFRHPILHRALYDAVPPGWRLAAHARAAGTLELRGAPPFALAPHVALSAPSGDSEAVALLMAAGRSVKGHAPQSAQRWLTEALRLLGSGAGTEPTRAEILSELADARSACGDLVGAHEAYDATLALLAPGDPRRAAAITRTASIEHALGRFDAARSRLTSALAGPDATSAAGAAPFELALALADLFDLDFGGAAQRAQALAEGAASGPIRATALALRCYVLCCAGEETAGLDAHGPALAAVDRLTDDELAEGSDAAYYLGAAEYILGLYQRACQHLSRSVTAGPVGNPLAVAALKDHARALAALGRLEEAAERAVAAVEQARFNANSWLAGFSLAGQAEVLTRIGDLSGAQQAVEESIRLTPPEARYFRSGLDRQLALIHLEGGHPAEAKALLDRAGAPDFPIVEPGTRCLVHETHARVELAVGDLTAARQAAERATTAAIRNPLPVRQAQAGRARAAVALSAGDHLEAAEEAQRAASLAHRAGAALDAAQALLLGGVAWAQAGARDKAVTALSEAEAILSSSGALAQRDRSAQLLRQLGVRQPGRGRRGAGGAAIDTLSGRERQVAELVAAGHSNRQIAATLYISEKTVEAHLGRVFAKLGVSRRSGVVIAFERSGRTR